MKQINKQTIVAALLGGLATLTLTVGGVALAHGAPHGGPHGKGGGWSPEKMEAHLTEMTERLGLSDEQKANVRAALEEMQTKAQEIKEMPRSKEKLVAFRDLRFATEDKIYANLTCEQRDELRLLKREHKAERMEARFERRRSENSN